MLSFGGRGAVCVERFWIVEWDQDEIRGRGYRRQLLRLALIWPGSWGGGGPWVSSRPSPVHQSREAQRDSTQVDSRKTKGFALSLKVSSRTCGELCSLGLTPDLVERLTWISPHIHGFLARQYLDGHGIATCQGEWHPPRAYQWGQSLLTRGPLSFSMSPVWGVWARRPRAQASAFASACALATDAYCGTLGKLINISAPPFSQMSNGDSNCS